MKTFNSLLVAAAIIGQLALSSDIQARDPAPYQPTGCKYNLVSRASPCNKKGTLKSPDNLRKPVTVPTANGCADFCFSNSNCESFAYTAKTKKCQLYAATLSQQNYKSGGSGPVFSNRDCYKQQCVCGNTGLNYGIFEDLTSDMSSQYTYERTWNPKTITGNGGDFVGGAIADTIGFQGTRNLAEDPTITLYGQTYSPPNGSYYFAVSHTFYLLPNVTGEYTIDVNRFDDIVYMWVGDLAFSGWKRSNANLEAFYPEQNRQGGFYAYAGQYLPIRVVYGQQGGPWTLLMALIDPNGNSVLNIDGKYPLIHTRSCDNTTAPPFPAFN